MGEFLQTMAIWSYEIMAISWWMIEQTYRTLLHKLKWMEHITSYHVVFDVHNNHLPKKLVMENKEYSNRMSKLIIAWHMQLWSYTIQDQAWGAVFFIIFIWLTIDIQTGGSCITYYYSLYVLNLFYFLIAFKTVLFCQ